MMGKERKGRKADNRNHKKSSVKYEDALVNDMLDDEIDTFHNQRDVVPLNINDDIGASDEDDEHPVFDFKDANDDEEDCEDENSDDDAQLTGLAAKISRQQKYLRAKVGGIEDEMDNDIEDKEEKRVVWGRRKSIYYNADNNDYELQSSDEELPAEEEAEVLRLRKENAKSLSLEDFGIEDVSQDESDGEPTLEEILVKGKAAPKPSAIKEAHDGLDSVYEEVKKDFSALSKEEQMDVVYSSAPELVGLLSELNGAFEELENKVNPLLNKVREQGNTRKEGMHYMEMKQLLLLAYCQSITFYLLLKSEGHPVRDHPVIARLVEVKNLLDKLKQLDEYLPSEIEDILRKKDNTVLKSLRKEDVGPASDSLIYDIKHAVGKQESIAVKLKADSSKDDVKTGKKHKHLSDHVGAQSMKMLKVRAALEEKLKQKGIFGSTISKGDKVQKRHLETMDDFDDDAPDLRKGTFGIGNEHANSLSSSKISQLATPRLNRTKNISGDDDLPRRDDIGERRRQHELRVLAGAGIGSGDEVGDGPDTLGNDEDHDMEEGDESESGDEFYIEIKQQRASKLAAKSSMYERTPAIQPIPEEALVDGKRHITYQMEKNRGLTRHRKKLTKNPRKKYRLQHKKTVVRRKGQVRDIRKPSGPYSGEASGINAGISRSIRFRG